MKSKTLENTSGYTYIKKGKTYYSFAGKELEDVTIEAAEKTLTLMLKEIKKIKK